MSENGGISEQKQNLYKNLADLSEKGQDTIIVVENGQPKTVVVPFDEYKNLKRGARKANKVKGVILAGGHATRLRPLTSVTNKHLLPIYDRPMIYYPLQAMARAGIKEVLITTNPEHAGDFLNLLGNGEEFGLKLHYALQKKPGGLAQAVSLAESFAGDDPFVVILGDNLFDFDLSASVQRLLKQGSGARIFAKAWPEPKAYGVVEMDSAGKVLSIEEKPENPKSNFIALGIYMYYPEVFNLIKNLKPSGRGELEITDLNNLYLERGDLYCEVFGQDDWWFDAGENHLQLLKANMAAGERMLKAEKEKIKEGLAGQAVSAPE